jgi:thiamine-monophosphate kinase
LADGPTLGELGEHPFLRALCARIRARAERVPRTRHTAQLLVPPGDDCAVLAPSAGKLAVTIDALVEDVHFRRAWLDAAEIGRRAVAVSLSDLAAMGAVPAWTLVGVMVPPELPASFLDELLDGCATASEQAGALMIGGNLTAAGALTVTVTAAGAVEDRVLCRGGAAVGDALVVTGTLGGAAAAVAAWSAGTAPSAELRARFTAPAPRIAAGVALARAGARAAIDVSDGLLADLGHLCAASGVGARIERARLPRLTEVAALDAAGSDFAASGGEDYELLLACPQALVARLDELANESGVALTVIGRCVAPADGIVLCDESGAPHDVRASGFDHFAGRA